VPTGFYLPGINNLDFVVVNANIGSNPTGLRIESIKGTYQVPEPGAACLAIAGMLISAVFARGARQQQRREANT
jgi:hypothetical protein